MKPLPKPGFTGEHVFTVTVRSSAPVEKVQAELARALGHVFLEVEVRHKSG